MKTFARIQDGVVMEIIIAEVLPEFHPEIAATFVEAPEGTEQHYLFDGTTFTPPIS